MFARFGVTDAVSITEDWIPSWSGDRKLYIVTDLKGDPTRFVAYGSDGEVEFRVFGNKSDDLTNFLARMEADGAEVVPAPNERHGLRPCDVIIKPPTIPCTESVQAVFDAELNATDIAA